MKQHRANTWNQFINNVASPQPSAFWSTVKSLNKKRSIEFSAITEGNRTIKAPDEILQCLSRHFQSRFTAPVMNRNNPTDKEALDLWELLDKANPEDIQLVNQCSDLKFISEEVWQVIKSLKGKNSSGFDLISNKMIKNLPHNYSNILTKQYNALFSLSYWDKNWKQARTICFNKVDSPAPTTQQLRPISLLPVMGKIYERLFLFRFQKWLNNFGILPWQKSGARAKQCTVSRVNHLLEQTYTSLLYNTFTLVVFIDFLQVFDILWQEERTMKIVLNGQLSNNIILQRGAPQGSVFGPIAYIVTHYDLQQIFKVPENNHLLEMCGIWCIFGSTVDTHQQVPGCFNIAHRGPDCFRFENVNHFSKCVFGFHRLAVVDDIFGMQPMRLHALPHIWMTYNGEIYNFREAQKKFGYKFETSCDGEILIHLYNDKGARFMCEQLYGVFAFVLFDTKERKIYVGRDTFGVRPSFRIFTECGFLAVSSEAKGLEGVTVASNQPLKIEAFEPGTYEEYKLDENEKAEFIKKERFHTIGVFPKYDVNVALTDDISLNIRSYLTNAVRMRLMSHRRIGSMLSGGLDSSIIAALTIQEARKQGINYPIQTFSIGMDDESPDLIAARKVAKHLGTEHHEIRFSAEDAIKHLKNIIKSLESYDITTIRASIGMYFVAKYIQEKTDTIVVLSGEGADEVCQGYIYFYRQPTPEEGDRESRRLCQDLYFYDVLRADRTTAAHGLELRVPFLDHAFTSYYLSLPAAERSPTKARAEKYLLRKAFDGLDLIPSEILWRPKEAFSDGVAAKTKSLFQYMQEHAETQVSDVDLQRAATLYPFNTPMTKEAFLYRSIFEEYYPGQPHLTPYIWLPKWCGDQTDPSARVLTHYKEQQKDSDKS
ncbi:unnamed protein product [Rotaria socialis]|uniref:Asparagine synthetase [glutamine-hydrolyzing] n=1 Tax=Rotaria socialis TaxID=392032 RepID=A0A820BI01_9BILA|nr:unnamed protein product [Rotaria socialis]